MERWKQIWAVFWASLSVLSLALSQQVPIIRQEPISNILNTIAGNSSYIACVIQEGDPRPTVRWYQGVTQVHVGERLEFSPAEEQHSGEYKCVASNSAGQMEQIFQVNVYGLQEDYGFVGYPSRLRSTQSVSGSGHKIIKWYDTYNMPTSGVDYKSNEILTYFNTLTMKKSGYGYDENTGDLLVPSTSLQHDGKYSLTVFNLITTSWSFNRLHVYVRPTEVRMTQFPDHVTESETVSAICIVDRVKPVNVTFMWTLGSNVDNSHTETSSQNTDGTFSIKSTLTRAFFRRDNEEQLKCEAIHGVDTTLRTNTQKQVFVYYNYQTSALAKDLHAKPIEKSEITLQCQITDEGKPFSRTYKWYKGTRELRNDVKFSGVNTMELTIKDLISSDNGNYGCRISNAAGQGIQDGTYQLEVLYKPKITLKGPIAVDEEEETILTCHVDSKPDFSQLVWFHNDRPLAAPTGDVAVYILPSAARTDRGTYKCEVTNDIGTSFKEHVLDVKYPPSGHPTIILANDRYVMKVNTTQELTCDLASLTDHGNPVHDRFIWVKNSQQMSYYEESLTISPTLVSHSASYKCAVSNEIGLSQYSPIVNITVEAPINIEDDISHRQLEPRFDDETFTISYTVSGGSDLHTQLENSSTVVSAEDFETRTENVNGDFPYGQKSAVKTSYTWKTSSRDLTSCDTVTYFNGDYSFKAFGTVARRPSTKTAVFRIAVQYPAIWRGAPKKNSSATKIDKTLVCDICANPAPSKYSWTHNGGELPLGTTKDGNMLHISPVEVKHFGDYRCTAYNIVGNEPVSRSFDITLEERGSPHVPENVHVASQTSETLLIRWSAGFNGGYPITGYELQYRRAGSGRKWVSFVDLPLCEDVCEKRIMGLNPTMNYSIQVRAKNERPIEFGPSDPYSDFVKILAKTKALPPLSFLPAEISSKALTIRWTLKSDSMKRRRRDASQDGKVGLTILYKKESEATFNQWPENEHKRVDVADLKVVVPGNFDVTQKYNIQVDVYEGEFKVAALTNDLSTDPRAQAKVAEAGTAMIAGIVLAIVLVLALVVLGLVFWHRRHASQGSDVEMRRKAHSAENLVCGHVTSSSSGHVTNNSSVDRNNAEPPIQTEMPRPPMPRPMKSRPGSRPDSNGQPFKENPYMNVGQDKPPHPLPGEGESLYENVRKQPQYENVSFKGHPPLPPYGESGIHQPNDQAEGPDDSDKKTMNYTDVTFDSNPRPIRDISQIHIHGKENRVDYAQLDFAKMAKQQHNGRESEI